MAKAVVVRAGSTWAGRDGLCPMNDAEYNSVVDRSPSIGDAYSRLGRIGNPMRRACEYANTFGIHSRIGGVPRGEAPPSLVGVRA